MSYISRDIREELAMDGSETFWHAYDGPFPGDDSVEVLRIWYACL